MNKISEKEVEELEYLGPNKSQLKRDSHELVKLGEDIAKLKKEEIDALELPDELDDAIRTVIKIKSNAGSKRQRLYIGKLLRNHDHETIARQVHKIKHRHDTNTAAFKRLEKWRDKLIEGDNSVLSEIIGHYQQDVNRQHISQLIRSAKQEQTQNKPPASARKLFRYLQELEDNHSNLEY